jgi:hypothetical protein
VSGAGIDRGARQTGARAGWKNGNDAIAPPGGKWLACKPFTEATRRVDCPLGNFRSNAKPLGQLSISKGPETRNQEPGEARRDAVVDVHVGRDGRIDEVSPLFELDNRQSVPADRAENGTGVFALREDHSPLAIPPDHLRESPRSVSVIGLIAVVIENVDVVARELEETRRRGGQLRCVEERQVDVEWGVRRAGAHLTFERGRCQDAINRRGHFRREKLSRSEQRPPWSCGNAAGAGCEDQLMRYGRHERPGATRQLPHASPRTWLTHALRLIDSKQAGRAGPGSLRRVGRNDIERADADPIGNGPGHRLDDE